MKYKFAIKKPDFEKIRLGTQTFLSFKDTLSFSVGDEITLSEVLGELYTGRVMELIVTGVQDSTREGYVLLSFQITFPSVEPKIPISVYMELFAKLAGVDREVDALRAELDALKAEVSPV